MKKREDRRGKNKHDDRGKKMEKRWRKKGR